MFFFSAYATCYDTLVIGIQYTNRRYTCSLLICPFAPCSMTMINQKTDFRHSLQMMPCFRPSFSMVFPLVNRVSQPEYPLCYDTIRWLSQPPAFNCDVVRVTARRNRRLSIESLGRRTGACAYYMIEIMTIIIITQFNVQEKERKSENLFHFFPLGLGWLRGVCCSDGINHLPHRVNANQKLELHTCNAVGPLCAPRTYPSWPYPQCIL